MTLAPGIQCPLLAPVSTCANVDILAHIIKLIFFLKKELSAGFQWGWIPFKCTQICWQHPKAHNPESDGPVPPSPPGLIDFGHSVTEFLLSLFALGLLGLGFSDEQSHCFCLPHG